MKQRMFVLSRKTSELDSSVEIFDVAGSVGNVCRVFQCMDDISSNTQLLDVYCDRWHQN